MTARVVAVELAKAGEHLQRAALAVAQLDPSFAPAALAWSREVNDLLERSLAFHDRAYVDELRARESVAA